MASSTQRPETSILAEFLSTTGPEDVYQPPAPVPKKKTSTSSKILHPIKTLGTLQKSKSLRVPKSAAVPRITHDGRPYLAIRSAQTPQDPRRDDLSTNTGDLATNKASFLPTNYNHSPEPVNAAQSLQRQRATSNGAQRTPLEPFSEPSPVVISGNSFMPQGIQPRPSFQSTSHSSSTWGDPVLYQARRASVDQGIVYMPTQEQPRKLSSDIHPRKADHTGIHTTGPSAGALRRASIPEEQLSCKDSITVPNSNVSEHSLAESIQFLQILSQEGGDDSEAHLDGRDYQDQSQPATESSIKSRALPTESTRGTPGFADVRSRPPVGTTDHPTSLTGRLRHAAATSIDTSRQDTTNRDKSLFGHNRKVSSGSSRSAKVHGHVDSSSAGHLRYTNTAAAEPAMANPLIQEQLPHSHQTEASSHRTLEYADSGNSDFGGMPILLYNQPYVRPSDPGAQPVTGEPKIVASSSTTIPREIGGAIVDRLHDLEQRNRNLETALLALLNPGTTTENPAPTSHRKS